jgi:RNA polymerase sigma-70 factor (ECF subfamily)
VAALSGTFPLHGAITVVMRDEAGDVSGDISDSDLMRRTAEGDRDAFALIYRKYHAIVYRFARLMTGSNEAAEDVVQEVFLALMRGASRYDATRSTLSTYLYGSARHHIRRRLFRDRVFVPLDDSGPDLCCAPSGATAADELARQRDVRDVRRAVLALPARYREVIVLCDLHDLSYADAAVAIGCAVGTVRSRLHRGRQLLMQKMQRSRACALAPAQPTVRCEV